MYKYGKGIKAAQNFLFLDLHDNHSEQIQQKVSVCRC